MGDCHGQDAAGKHTEREGAESAALGDYSVKGHDVALTRPTHAAHAEAQPRAEAHPSLHARRSAHTAAESARMPQAPAGSGRGH